MINSTFKRITSATALFLVVAISQVYLTVSLAGPGGNSNVSQQQSPAILTTSGNKPISVNGASAVSGATIITGAMIETPDQVEATVNVPGHFSLEIRPNAKLTTEFDSNRIKVTLIRGCVELHTKQGTSGEIVDEKGRSREKADPARDAILTVCEPRGGIGTAATLGIVGAGAAALAIALASGGGGGSRGVNPSPSAP